MRTIATTLLAVVLLVGLLGPGCSEDPRSCLLSCCDEDGARDHCPDRADNCADYAEDPDGDRATAWGNCVERMATENPEIAECLGSCRELGPAEGD